MGRGCGRTLPGEAGHVRAQVLHPPALQVDGQLEGGDPVGAADGPETGHHRGAELDLLQQLAEHWRENTGTSLQCPHGVPDLVSR